MKLDEKVQMVLRVSYQTREQLRRMARDDRRSLSGTVAVMVDAESARRLSALAVAAGDEPFGTEE